MTAEATEDAIPDFFFIERDDPERAVDTIKQMVTERIPRRFGLHPVDDIQVLTPMHRGTLGATHLNAELQAQLTPHGPALTRGAAAYRVGDKVMQIRNNYQLGVFNGDIGRVTAIDQEEHELAVRYEDDEVRYDRANLDDLVLAFACSIHKSQGSEYPAVVMPIHTQHYVLLQRNLLYTGITRGRRLVVVIGTKKALAMAVKNDRVAERWTRLAARLRAARVDPEPSAQVR
jgi:exodeoxyribonuclease V alpha subunit